MGVRILEGDCRTLLPTLPAASVHCVVTSPPYWGLRDYGCEGQLGLEATPAAYIENMVGVFRAVRRVLRADGTLWLNMGDSYAGQPGGPQGASGDRATRTFTAVDCGGRGGNGLKPKDLVGMPWRLAFALQADGWYLRADIIWAKPNPMPESVTDRPTKAHEYIFLLSKSRSYFYDADAVREPHQDREGIARFVNGCGVGERQTNQGWTGGDVALDKHREYNPAGRNLRSVWSIPSAPFPDAHFATFPPALASRCIQAGTSEKGCCAACGAPWTRVVEHTLVPQYASRHGGYHARGSADGMVDLSTTWTPGTKDTRTLGWKPSCLCMDEIEHEIAPIPCTVLDPFAGSGTVGAVAEQLGRHSVLIELSPTYIQMADERTAQLGLFTLPLPPRVGTPHAACYTTPPWPDAHTRASTPATAAATASPSTTPPPTTASPPPPPSPHATPAPPGSAATAPASSPHPPPAPTGKCAPTRPTTATSPPAAPPTPPSPTPCAPASSPFALDADYDRNAHPRRSPRAWSAPASHSPD